MKIKVFLIVVLGITTVLAYALPSMARGPYPYYGGHYYGHHHGSGGAYIAGAIVGGILLGSLISAVTAPTYYARQPEPAYAYPPSSGSSYDYNAPPGEWVVVPGKWVNGKWVPSHRVWVPVDPY
jgi:hypothetical protein